MRNSGPPEPTAALGLAAVIFAVAMWGMVPVCVRFLLQSLSPEAVMVLRVYSSGLIALAVLLFSGIKPIAARDWPRILIAALLGNTGYQVLAHYGMTTVPASWTGMIFGLEPVFIALFAVLLAGDRLTLWLGLGIAVSLLGTAVLFIGPATGVASEAGLFGLMLVTLSTMGWGIYTVVLRPLVPVYGAFALTCLTLGLSALPMVAFMTPATLAELPRAGLQAFAVAGFLVVFATFGAVAAWNYALNHLSSARAGVFLYAQPAIAALGGWLVLGERMSPTVIAGGVLILAGVAIAQWKPR